jgi:hypothetical protein
MIFSIPLESLRVVTPIQNIIEDTQDIIPWIPMITEIEYTVTNWAEKRPWEGVQ